MSSLREVAESLLYRYAAVIDDGDLVDWPGFFAEDAEYRLLPRENFVRGLPASLIYCKSRAMMRDRVIAIKKASVYTPHYYRHLYGNVLVERAGPQATLRANYIVCRTQDDGDSIIFSTGRVVAAFSVPEELLTVPPPSSFTPKSEPGGPETPITRMTGLDSSPPSMPPRTVRVGIEPMPPTMSPRSLTLGPPSIPPRSLAFGPASIAPGSTADSGLTLPPPSRRRGHTSPTFLSMTVIYDTCRIPGLLVFPI